MTQFKILLFLLCVNISACVILNAQTGGAYIFAGVRYAAPLNETGSLSDLEENFNGTQIIGGPDGTGGWQPVGGLGFAGDIFSSLNMFWNIFRFLIDGLGMTIEWVGSMSPTGQAVFMGLSMFQAIAWLFRILGGVVFTTLIIEFISNRNLME